MAKRPDYRQIFGTPLVDTIEERTPGAGVTVDSVLLKDGYVALPEIAAPTEIADKGIIYVGTDGELYVKDEDGNDIALTAGDQIAGNWTKVGNDIYNNNSGNVGIGGSHTPDELVHAAKAVEDGDVAFLIENSFANGAASTDETASIKFGFGGVNNAVEMQAIKVSDFTSAANQDSGLDINILLDGVSNNGMRLRPGMMSLFTIGGFNPSYGLDVKAGTVNAFRFQRYGSSDQLTLKVSTYATWNLGNGPGNYFSWIPGPAGPSGHGMRLYASSDSEVQLAINKATGTPSAALEVRKTSADFGGYSGLDGGTVAVFRYAQGTGSDVAVSLVSGTSGDVRLNFGDTDASARGRFIYFNATDTFTVYTANTPAIYIDSSQQVGVGAAPDELFHVTGDVDGDLVAALFENAQAADAGTNETVQLRFGFGGNNDVARIVVGKVNDYQAGADEDSFMALYVDVGGTATEAMRVTEDSGTFLVGIGVTGPTSKLDVAGDIEIGDANALYYGDPTTNDTWRTVRSGDDLSFQRREGGSYVEKGAFTAASARIVGNLDVGGGVAVADDDAYYLGDRNSDGSWRIRRDGDDLVMEQRESGIWETKDVISGAGGS